MKENERHIYFCNWIKVDSESSMQVAYCGKELSSDEFSFRTIEHALGCIRSKDPLVPCRDCLNEIKYTIEESINE